MPARLDKAFLEFHKNLKKHNDRAWFQARKETYETAVREPMLALISALQPGMRARP
jgi:uncharacterized protein (DUF2461 family)